MVRSCVSRRLRKTAKHPPGSATAKPLGTPFIHTQLTHFSHVLKGKRGKMKIFLTLRIFAHFPLLLVSFGHLRLFQITPLLSTPYRKNEPLPSRLQRLPRSKMTACDPLRSTLFGQSKLLCFTTQVTLLFKVTYFHPQNSLSFSPKSAHFDFTFASLNLQK